jgi:carbon-monoxide dehydrogenase medium subunit
LSLLADYEGEAKPLAGGQSLVPSMNFRLAQPSILVDLNGIDDLAGVRFGREGSVTVRAMTRQSAVEKNKRIAELAPALAEAMPYIAHPQIRNRGTIGGSLAHADPAAELPAVMVAMQASLVVESAGGKRTVKASDFFQGLFTTTLEPGELLVEVEIPALRPGEGTAFEEFARRHGDYALAGAVARVRLGNDGKIAGGSLVFFAVGDVPIESASAYQVLRGERPTPEAILAAAEASLADIDPQSDIHATAPYRRHLAKVLARHTLTRAAERAENVTSNA